MIKLSAPEQSLLDFSREQFGEHLSQFLLAGLGEENNEQRWHFAITYLNKDGAELLRRVEVITYEPPDGSTLMPRMRDPLVLLALLQLLLRRDQISPGNLRYEQEDILSLLGWEDTKEARGEIDEAVERYFLLVYKWKMNKSELLRKKLTFYTASENLMSEYEIVDREVGELGRAGHIFNRVAFNVHFTEQLLRRSLFGIDWNSVRAISRRFSSNK